jgi:group I intron endonuclease
MAYVYIIFSNRTRKRYVGCTKRSLKRRFKEHKKASSLIGRRIRKLGIKTFKIRVLKKLTEKDNMFKIERYYINKLNTKTPNGYNLA